MAKRPARKPSKPSKPSTAAELHEAARLARRAGQSPDAVRKLLDAARQAERRA